MKRRPLVPSDSSKANGTTGAASPAAEAGRRGWVRQPSPVRLQHDFSGVFEGNPRLKLGVVGYEVWWAPYFMNRPLLVHQRRQEQGDLIQGLTRVCVCSVNRLDASCQVAASMSATSHLKNPDTFRSLIESNEAIASRWAPVFVKSATAWPLTQTDNVEKRNRRKSALSLYRTKPDETLSWRLMAPFSLKNRLSCLQPLSFRLVATTVIGFPFMLDTAQPNTLAG